VASLDWLSVCRVELGLGGRHLWDEIDAMGGRRLSPDESVKALGRRFNLGTDYGVLQVYARS
jgi:hypothetical protein